MGENGLAQGGGGQGRVAVPAPPFPPDEAVLPAYDAGWLGNVVPALTDGGTPAWVPPAVRGAGRIVLFLVDGLGEHMILQGRAHLPAIAGLQGGPITSCVPSTTVAALTSLATGVPPSVHGLVGYRFRLAGQIFSPLQWKLSGAGPVPEPAILQPLVPFRGRRVPVVNREEFRGGGFTQAHLRGGEFRGWEQPQDLVAGVAAAVADGHELVYAYDDRVDKVAHGEGLESDAYVAALRTVDAVVASLLDVLPPDCAVVVTADHGHIPVDRERLHDLGDLRTLTSQMAGEARFRSLHAAPGATVRLRRVAQDRYEGRAWVLTRDEVVDSRLLGPRPGLSVRSRIGDVVLIARENHGFVDPDYPQEAQLASMHGGLAPEEMLVPLRAGRGRAAART